MERPSAAQIRRAERIRVQLQQVESSCVPIRRRASQAKSENCALEEQLEDAWVAIVGYQVDCENERARQRELEESLGQLELESEIFEKKALDAMKRNGRLVEEVGDAARIEPLLGDVVTELCAELAETSGKEGILRSEEGDEAIFAQEVAHLRSFSSLAEVRSTQDLEIEKLWETEARLDAYHQELEAALQSRLNDDRRYQDRDFPNGVGDPPCVSFQEMLAEAKELHEKAMHLECLACEIVR